MAPKKRSSSASAAASPEASFDSKAEVSSTMDLNVGETRYPCLCTRDPEAADKWASGILESIGTSASAATVVSVDCEWAAPWYRAGGADRLGTLQISHHGQEGMRVLVFSVASLGGKLPASVVSLLGDDRVAKVGANLAGDATRIVRDFGCPVRGIYDLSRLNKKPGAKGKKSISLEAVVKANCPEAMHINKAGADVRTSNWEAWPLSQEQVLYASRDAALGLLAFMFKFGMQPTSSPELPKDAVDALVDLASVDVTSLEAVDDTQAASTEPATDGEKKKDHANFFQHMRNSNVKPPNLGKKHHPKGAADALAKVNIVVSGTLDSFERSDMEKYVKDHGGKVSKSVTAKVTHLVTDHGEAGPSKLAKCKEFGIPVVSEDVILKMVGGDVALQIAGTEEAEVTKTVEVASDKQDVAPDKAVVQSSSEEAKNESKKRGRQSKKSILANKSEDEEKAIEASTPAAAEATTSKEASDSKTGDKAANDTSSSVAATNDSKKRGRQSKQQTASDVASKGTEEVETKGTNTAVSVATGPVSNKGAGRKPGRQSKFFTKKENSEAEKKEAPVSTTSVEATNDVKKQAPRKKPTAEKPLANKENTEAEKKDDPVATASATVRENTNLEKKDESVATASTTVATSEGKKQAPRKKSNADKSSTNKKQTELEKKDDLVATTSTTEAASEGKKQAPRKKAITDNSSSKNVNSEGAKIGTEETSSAAAQSEGKKRGRQSKQSVAEQSPIAKEGTAVAKTGDSVVADTNSSVSTKKRGRPSKQQTGTDESSTAAQRAEGKPIESTTATTTPPRKRIKRTVKESVEIKGKDETKHATPEPPKATAATAENSSSMKGTDVTTTPGKSTKADAEIQPTPTKKARKMVQPSEAKTVEVDKETLDKAKGLSMQSQLLNLAGRWELRGQDFSAASLLAALEKSKGLVNPAKHLLLGS